MKKKQANVQVERGVVNRSTGVRSFHSFHDAVDVTVFGSLKMRRSELGKRGVLDLDVKQQVSRRVCDHFIKRGDLLLGASIPRRARKRNRSACQPFAPVSLQLSQRVSRYRDFLIAIAIDYVFTRLRLLLTHFVVVKHHDFLVFRELEVEFHAQKASRARLLEPSQRVLHFAAFRAIPDRVHSAPAMPQPQWRRSGRIRVREASQHLVV